MVSNLEAVSREVEKLRQRLYELAKGRTLTDPAIVAASQELDHWLNVYNELLRQNKQLRKVQYPMQ
ncbi:aspartyl-phosphate phosphatase Spo0E family protein [Brevibacillus dissolubilis]|uniref:aspartyl-phosphate phosphatase Spo0E family protein n=1 Tax=Brevibacillus dissolubilis TaxID=1844116 RepID=UPI00111628B8|nr:aspartyl-phosphate phosphatase Spo0E family protein [Brevibacillus dissolubilis]